MISGRLTYMIALILSITRDRGIMTNPLRKFPLYTVNSCPGNRTEWERASRRLNCTMQPDVFENRYHCVATRDRSRLMEFCYPLSRSLFGKGQCVIFDPPSTLDNYTCLHFTDGCPDDHYYTDKLYKYPNCFRIEPALKCFISDESCLTRNWITTIQTEINSTSQTFIVQNATTQVQKEIDLVPVLVPTFVVLGFILGIVIFTMIRLKRRSGRNFVTRKSLERSVQGVKSDVTEFLLKRETESVNSTDSKDTYAEQGESEREDKNGIVDECHTDEENTVLLSDTSEEHETKVEQSDKLNNTDSREKCDEYNDCKKEDGNLPVVNYEYQRDRKYADKTRDANYLQDRKKINEEMQQKIDKSREVLREFEENICPVLVETRARKKVFTALEKRGYVVVKGNPGNGKTTMARHILLELEKGGRNPVEIYSVTEIEAIPMCSNIAIFIDNLFGESSVLEDELHKFSVRENMIKATVSNEKGNGNMLIATIRNDIYKECEERFRNNEFFRSSVIDISNTENKINREEFEEICEKIQVTTIKSRYRKIRYPRFWTFNRNSTMFYIVEKQIKQRY